ncbi:hypothetical protein K1T71_010701 [Dendrolimus kikuchii]|uniref:Uncharacterized protein n=1 Tax=Dendrolimus kikuchii TaxID=765133 RepID=A0ACC1CPX5_9NEOP|nr:hypothetical protein K1T71_010701 [Dendrolimus kikuchii]
MVVAKEMSKPTLKVSLDSGSSSDEELQKSDEENISEHSNVDADSESAASASNEEKEVLISNQGWANSVAKILNSNKPKNKKTLVLSRAKKHAEVLKKVKEDKPAFEVIGDENIKQEVKKEELHSEPPVKKVKNEKPSIRIKPNILDKDRERLLSKIATKGVVQLFNAVRNQQKSLEKQMDREDLTDTKKEKILKKFDKRAFLDTLMGQSKSVVVDDAAKTLKDEVKDEEKPRWSALREDFMMGAKMKDWDKESVDD